MGKTNNRRSALGHHARQAAQTGMIIRGWQAVRGDSAHHQEHGIVTKLRGQYTRYRQGFVSINMLDNPEYCEWDDLSTPRVLWLYKVLKREKLL